MFDLLVNKLKQYLYGEIKSETLASSLVEYPVDVSVTNKTKKDYTEKKVVAVIKDGYDLETIKELMKIGFVVKRMEYVEEIE